MQQPAVFLDRDGVINALVWDERTQSFESPYRPEDVELLDSVANALKLLQKAGFLLVVVSNQPAAAKQNATLTDLRAVHDRISAEFLATGVEIDNYYYCFHHPDGSDPELSGPCRCRKPEAGLLLDAARELSIDIAKSWVVGDSDTDITAGQRAGCRTVLTKNPQSQHRRTGSASPTAEAENLHEAAETIIKLADR